MVRCRYVLLRVHTRARVRTLLRHICASVDTWFAFWVFADGNIDVYRLSNLEGGMLTDIEQATNLEHAIQKNLD